MRRGDIVTIALSGDYGKPRPALIVQSDFFLQTASVTILTFTSKLIDAPLFRIEIEPTLENGLKSVCYIMVDKTYTTPRDKVGKKIGALEHKMMIEVERSLAVFLGFG